MLTLSHTLIIQSPSRSRSYMGGDSGTCLGLSANLEGRDFLMTLHKVTPKNMICHFTDNVCHKSLESPRPYRSQSLW